MFYFERPSVISICKCSYDFCAHTLHKFRRYIILLPLPEFYAKVTELKQRGVKVTLAIGGWNDSLGDKYSRLVNSPAARTKFINHVIGFLQAHNFDGLDLDWEYPVCWQVRLRGSTTPCTG
uniref:GH18 domain-containing protein n=1 Tax=Scylla olivacea TaxID=85551 RepID=A0A0P4VV53_SCYOL